jgi:hypothetical protein
VITLFLISPSMLTTGWSPWIIWHTLGCGDASPLSLSFSSSPWSLLNSWPRSFGLSSSSWLSWSRPYASEVVSFEEVSWGWLLRLCGLTTPTVILYRESHGASSTSTRSRSTCSFWESLVSSNTASHMVLTQLVVTLKTWYAWEFES